MKPVTLEAEKFGTYIARSEIVCGADVAIICWLMADTAIGVDCRFESRRCAVTTISSSCEADGAGPALCWALACTDRTKATAAASDEDARRTLFGRAMMF